VRPSAASSAAIRRATVAWLTPSARAAATATRDIADPLGGIIPAATVHRTALAELAHRFAIVMADTAARRSAEARAAA
jgi:hypothetical protein